MQNSTLRAEGNNDKGVVAQTTLVSRNITVAGRRTSVRLEPEMWNALREIAKREGCSIHDICTVVELRKNPKTSLTAAIRVFLMLYFRAASSEEGHLQAGHGNFETMKRRARIPQDIEFYFSCKQSKGQRLNRGSAGVAAAHRAVGVNGGGERPLQISSVS